MLEKGFEINFLTKTRVDKDSNNDDLIELEDGFYYPIETVFIGKNSSGKTTTLELLMVALDLLENGRIKKEHFKFNESFEIEMIFYVEKTIYKYCGSFKNDSLNDKAFLTILNESLEKTTLKESYKKDLSNASFFKLNGFSTNEGSDTSNIVKYSNDGSYSFLANEYCRSTFHFGIFYRILGERKFNAIVHLFDDSIEYIKPLETNKAIENSFRFKRVGDEAETLIEFRALDRILSKGTIKGVGLYSLSIIGFEKGGHLVVDEIEGSFNRNLIENLLIMYNDKTINKRGGSIIYSTHYSELLDTSTRCDNVNVLHRTKTSVAVKNMCLDYKIRTEMLKSNQFNQNTFDTLINYNRLMDLKEAIRQK